jgi:hypothetical protein
MIFMTGNTAVIILAIHRTKGGGIHLQARRPDGTEKIIVIPAAKLALIRALDRPLKDAADFLLDALPGEPDAMVAGVAGE